MQFDETQIKAITTVEELEQALQGADWTWGYSDDPRWYRRGQAEQGALREKAKELGAEALFESYKERYG